LISGRVWGIDSRRPISGTVIDIWQANSEGYYDNEDPEHPPAPGSFKNRVRLITDEHGGYEYETIHPGPYKMDLNTWRSPHVHYRVTHERYERLVTQLFFRGDPYEDSDPFFKQSLAIQLTQEQMNGKPLGRGVFDIVLVPVAVDPA
jgi:protocatechuate 3,4-dioxygenase beta subunit